MAQTTIPSGGGGTPDDNSVSTAKIQDSAVTLAKMADLATDKLIGRVSSGTGVPEAVTCTDFAQGLLDDADAAAGRTTLGLTAVAVSTGKVFLGRTVLTSASANFTTGPNTTQIVIRGYGGGGGGGGCSSTASQAAYGGGGGSGGYVEKQFTVLPSTAYAYTCGAAGTAGANTGGDGGAGGDSTFVVGATTVTAKGGAGGKGMTAGTSLSAGAGGAGGAVSTNGDLNLGGVPGGTGIRFTGLLNSASGAGGGYGGGAPVAPAGAGTDAVGNGAGGSGAGVVNGGGAQIGGAGSAGCWIVDEYGA